MSDETSVSPGFLTPAPTHSERNIALDADQTVISCGKCGRVLLIIACRNCFPGDGASLNALGSTITLKRDAQGDIPVKAGAPDALRMKINGPDMGHRC
jgi:hypothetical protein